MRRAGHYKRPRIMLRAMTKPLSSGGTKHEGFERSERGDAVIDVDEVTASVRDIFDR